MSNHASTAGARRPAVAGAALVIAQLKPLS
jgi:hypothetical protein